VKYSSQLISELGEKPASHKLFKSFIRKTRHRSPGNVGGSQRENPASQGPSGRDQGYQESQVRKKSWDLPFLQGGSQGNLGDALISRSKTLGDFHLLLKQTVDIESGV
jgi:hypothetical protein